MNFRQTNSSSKPSIFPEIQRQWVLDFAVFLIIVSIGVASRFWLVDMPNFKPVAALALLGGFFFRKSWLAIAALFTIMIISDQTLGGYEWKLALSVYLSLALACLLGVWVKRSIESGSQSKIGVGQCWRFGAASLVMSTVFYLSTNGVVWMTGDWYPNTWAGMVACYAAGLPFFRATIISDLFFTGAFVASYCVLEMLVAKFSKSDSGLLATQA